MHRHILTALILLATTGSQAAEVLQLNSIAAVVNNNVITTSELDRRTKMIRQRLTDSNTPIPPDNLLQRRVLEQMVLEKLQLEEAKNLGITIDDEALNIVIRNSASQNGLSLESFRRALERDGIDFALFREQIRNELIMTRVKKNRVDSRVIITDQEIDAHLTDVLHKGDQNREYRLLHILIALSDGATPAQIDDASTKAQGILNELRSGADFSNLAVRYSDGRQALSGGDLGWRKAGQLPTLFTDTVLKLDVGRISDTIRSPSGFHILKLAEVRGGESHIIKQVHARHILIRTNAVVSDDDAQSRLVRLFERLNHGDSFADLARANSEDPTSRIKGGDLGWADPQNYAPAFRDKLEEMQPGQISAPFKSQFGWHIVELLGRRDYDNTEEFRRAEARRQIHERKVAEEEELWLRRILDTAYVEYRNEG